MMRTGNGKSWIPVESYMPQYHPLSFEKLELLKIGSNYSTERS